MQNLFRWATLLSALSLLFLMLGPFQGAERSLGLTDKPAHALAFAAITAAVFLNWPRASRLQAAGVALLIGGAVEILQAMTGRDGELADLVADGVGILIVAFLWRHCRPR